MATKAGSAADAMQRVALAAALLLEIQMRRLVEACAADDAPSVDAVAKQVKAIADAGRSAVALDAAAAKAAAREPDVANPPDPDNDEMDMDDEPRARRSPEELLELRAELDRQLERVLGAGDQKSAERRPGGAGHRSDAGAMGDRVPARAEPA